MADLPLRRYSNQAPDTTLDGTITAAATSLDVASATGYPTAPFTISVEGEIMLVTAKSGTTFTVTREYNDSSSAAIHTDGVTVTHVLIADDFDHRWQDVIVSPAFGSIDDEFDDNDASGLSTVSLGTATWTESNGVLSAVFSGQSANQIAARVTPLTAIPIGSGVQTAVRIMGAADYAMAGPVLSAGVTTTHNVVFQALEVAPGTPNASIELHSGTFAAASTNHYTDTVAPIMGGWMHMRLVWVSVNLFRAWWSIDGVSWSDFGQGSFAITGTSPPTHMGVGVSAWGGSGDKLASFEYLRIWEP